MQEVIREIRKEIDNLAQLTNQLPPTREVALARTAFEVSKMMLGKVLGEMGTANPYPESKDPSSSVIEKTADVGAPDKLSPDLSHVGKVKTIRQSGEDVSNKIKSLLTGNQVRHVIDVFCETSYLECTKGVMWLGMELGRIKQVEEADAERAKDVPQANPTGH